MVTFGGEAEGEMVCEFDRGEKWGGGGLNTLEGDCSADDIKTRGGRILAGAWKSEEAGVVPPMRPEEPKCPGSTRRRKGKT